MIYRVIDPSENATYSHLLAAHDTPDVQKWLRKPFLDERQWLHGRENEDCGCASGACGSGVNNTCSRR